MKKRKQPQVMESVAPNLIPMIDIMFLLLLFFMLGADMAQRETAAMILPQADKAVELPPEREKDQYNVNIHHSPDGNAACPVYDNNGICREPGHWKWSIQGKEYTRDTIGDKLQILADLNKQTAPDPVAQKILSETKILVRADQTAPYGDVQKVIEYIGTTGIFKVSVVGALPPEQ